MNESLQPIPELSRQELLAAIDYEIAQRESLLARHGITTWGVAGAAVALVWLLATEAPGPPHNLANVLLVLLVGRWALTFLSWPFAKALSSGLPADGRGRR